MRISLPWDADVDVDGRQSQVHPFALGRRRLSEADGCCSGSILDIPSEIVQQILMKLPTKDVARSCCVSRQWRSAVRDPSFRKLHAASHAALSAEAEFLLLSDVPCEFSQRFKTGVFSLSSDKPMCSIAKPNGYGLANICNGLLCFVLEGSKGQAPALVCNPVTGGGETLALPAAPPLSSKGHVYFVAFGFSPPTNEYKLFRLSFPPYSCSSQERVNVDVYTLGDARGWRKDSFLSPSRPPFRRDNTSTTLLINGKLHVVTKPWNAPLGQVAAGVLVVDVPAETYHAYPLPDDLMTTYRYDNPLAFELKGSLCLAAHMLSGGRPKALCFWVMAMESKESDGEKEPHWDLRYSFVVQVEHPREPWSAWFQYETLYYTCGDTLHGYDTRSSIADNGRLLQWNKQLETTTTSSHRRWMTHPGYRPTLLSPRVFELPPSHMMDICS
uniref:F-box domain-containing protein n=1 Tax=Hordeum vulgare subsp. vulgare TaxID=112509 RepID=A0A8I6X206_HORVV